MECVFIELYGIPGVGKTTVSNILKKKFQTRGQNVTVYAELFRNIQMEDAWKWKLLVSEIDFDLLKIFCSLLQIWNSIPNKNRFDLKYTFYISLNFLVYKRISKSEKGIVLCEEGIIQYVFSIYYNRSIGNINEIRCILNATRKIFSHCIYVNLIADHETIAQRIKKRPNGKSRLDDENESSIHDIINIQERNMDLVSCLIPEASKVVVSTENVPDDVANCIMDRLRV